MTFDETKNLFIKKKKERNTERNENENFIFIDEINNINNIGVV